MSLSSSEIKNYKIRINTQLLKIAAGIDSDDELLRLNMRKLFKKFPVEILESKIDSKKDDLRILFANFPKAQFVEFAQLVGVYFGHLSVFNCVDALGFFKPQQLDICCRPSFSDIVISEIENIKKEYSDKIHDSLAELLIPDLENIVREYAATPTFKK